MPKRLTPRGEAAPPVEPVITGATLPVAPAKKQARKPKPTDSGVRYVRNLHYIQARVTLTTGREIQLQPRGQREDLDIVNAAEREDPRFLANEGLIFEVIEVDAAKEIIAHQQTNISRKHPALEQLRNEYGKEYEQSSVNLEVPTSVTVAQIAKSGDTRYTQNNVEVVRGPQITSVPGSPGHPATETMLQDLPNEVSPEEYHEFLLWKKFHEAAKAAEAIENLNVTVEPLQVEDED